LQLFVFDLDGQGINILQAKREEREVRSHKEQRESPRWRELAAQEAQSWRAVESSEWGATRREKKSRKRRTKLAVVWWSATSAEEK
jgi:hypothetical protein